MNRGKQDEIVMDDKLSLFRKDKLRKTTVMYATEICLTEKYEREYLAIKLMRLRIVP